MQDLLNKWGIKLDYNMLLSMWNESHRHYHNQNHLIDLIDQVNEMQSKLSEKEYDKLLLCSLFHDIVYDPSKIDNEEKSADFFIEKCSNVNADILEVKQMILDTKTHKPSSNLSETFSSMDMSIVESDFERLLEWEDGISKEFAIFGDLYKPNRLAFLEKMMNEYPSNSTNLLKLIESIEAE
jgi:predicted metal-dependent HD superfamily phosphohydrolase